jgi:drug/metabolite transporter (DMT)-like permease
MPKRAIGSFYLVATATGWALGWSAMKLLMRDWPPLFSRGVAGIAACLILAIIAVCSGESLYVPRKAIRSRDNLESVAASPLCRRAGYVASRFGMPADGHSWVGI